MAPRARKRVQAFRRAPGGSAFQKCESCGGSIAVALLDMHECEQKKVKRSTATLGIRGQPRSPFRCFMETFEKTCEVGNFLQVDREGFSKWISMSPKERDRFVIQAEKINSLYDKLLQEESYVMPKVDDEADSAMVGKFDKGCPDHWEQFGRSDSLGSDNWLIADSWFS